MAATAIDSKKPAGALLGLLKRIALLRESPVGMIGAALVLFWILVALLRPDLAIRPE